MTPENFELYNYQILKKIKKKFLLSGIVALISFGIFIGFFFNLALNSAYLPIRIWYCLYSEVIFIFLLNKFIGFRKQLSNQWQKIFISQYINQIPELSSWNRYSSETGYLLKMGKIVKLRINYDDPILITESVSKLKYLKEVEIKSLPVVPRFIALLKSLKKLNLSSNGLETLPLWLINLKNLKSLDISRNNFSIMPEIIENLRSLKELNVGANDMDISQIDFRNLKKLRILKINNNRVESFPESFQTLIFLKELDLQGCDMSSIPDPEVFRKLKNLKNFNLSLNELTHLPESFNFLRKLEILNISNNNMSSFPQCIKYFKKLRDLDIYYNPNINRIPNWLGSLKKIEELGLSGLDLGTLPSCMKNLKNLKGLAIDECNLSALPEFFSNFRNLEVLFADHNDFYCIPEVIRKLKKIEFLGLDKTYISNIPDWIGDLSNLKDLWFSNNLIEGLPQSIEKLNLNLLILSNNNFKTLSNIPENIISISSFEDNNLVKKGQKLANDKNIKGLIEFYKKTSLELAIQYNHEPISLTDEEKERLVWEAGIMELRIIELNSEIKDPIMVEISKRLTVELPTGYKLMM